MESATLIFHHDGPAVLRHVCEVLDLDNSRPIRHVRVRRGPFAQYDDGLSISYIERRKRTAWGRTFCPNDPAYQQVVIDGEVVFDTRDILGPPPAVDGAACLPT